MKTIFYTLIFAFVIAVVPVFGETGTLSAAVQKGLFEEEVNRDFGAAIAAYESAIGRFDEDRQVAATAMFRLAEIYFRSERMAEAEALYERVVREFSDQTELVKLASERLPEGKVGAEEIVTIDPEAEEIEKLKAILRDSPDLLYSRNNELSEVSKSRENTRLHDAIEKGQLRVADFLIKHGLDVNSENWRGWTPLHVAVEQGSKSAVEFLLGKGADIGRMNNNGETPLHVAAKRGYLAVAELLLDDSADVNASNSEGWTPLHVSVSGNYVQLSQFLLNKGANVNALDKYGRSPLDVSLRDAASETSEILLKHGAKGGKYYVRVLRADEQDQYVFWDRAETRSLVQVLVETGIDLQTVKLIKIGRDSNKSIGQIVFSTKTLSLPLSVEAEDMEIQDGAIILLE